MQFRLWCVIETDFFLISVSFDMNVVGMIVLYQCFVVFCVCFCVLLLLSSLLLFLLVIWPGLISIKFMFSYFWFCLFLAPFYFIVNINCGISTAVVCEFWFMPFAEDITLMLLWNVALLENEYVKLKRICVFMCLSHRIQLSCLVVYFGFIAFVAQTFQCCVKSVCTTVPHRTA